MELYVAGYHNVLVRFLHSFFIQMPLTIWFRFISRLIPSNKGIINYSGVPDATLMQVWQAAQKNLATNTFSLSAWGPDPHPADPRALTIQPRNVTVVAVPDVPIKDLIEIDIAWAKDTDPSKAILMLGNGLLGYETVHGFTCPWARPRVYGAASEIAAVCEWEFENIILNKLGYDIEGR